MVHQLIPYLCPVSALAFLAQRVKFRGRWKLLRMDSGRKAEKGKEEENKKWRLNDVRKKLQEASRHKGTKEQEKNWKKRWSGAAGGEVLSTPINPHEKATPGLTGSCLINQTEHTDNPLGPLL